MSVTTPGPAVDLISYAARIIVAAMKQPHTAPGHWAGALWEAGMLVAPGTGSTALPEIRDRDTESTSAALARVTAERDRFKAAHASICDEFNALNENQIAVVAERERLEGVVEGLRRTVTELTAERDEARAELASVRAELDLWRADSAEIATHDAWACLDDDGCGRRYGYPDPETHELTCGRALTPVRVTITRRTAGEPLEEGKAPHA